jgi:hypothetical protein
MTTTATASPVQIFAARINALVAQGMLDSEARHTVIVNAIHAWRK